MGRGESLKEMVVARVIKHPLVPVYQYSFEAPNDGFACGEQSIRATKDGRDLTMSEVIQKDEAPSTINTIASAKRRVIDFEEFGLAVPFSDAQVSFKPSLSFCDWTRRYADGRVIFHIWSGQGNFVSMLKMKGARAIGIEPDFDKSTWIKWRTSHDGRIPDINEILEGDVDRYKSLFLPGGVLAIFTNPKRNVEWALQFIPKEVEVLVISKTTPSLPATIIPHEGVSEGDEQVYKLIR